MNRVSMFLLAFFLAASAVAASAVEIHVKQNNRPTIVDGYAAGIIDFTIEVTNRTTEPVEIRRIVVTSSERRESQGDPARLAAAKRGFSFERQALQEKRTIAPGRMEEFRVTPEVAFGFAAIGDVLIDVTVVTPSRWEVVSVVQPMRLRVERVMTIRVR